MSKKQKHLEKLNDILELLEEYLEEPPNDAQVEEAADLLKATIKSFGTDNFDYDDDYEGDWDDEWDDDEDEEYYADEDMRDMFGEDADNDEFWED